MNLNCTSVLVLCVAFISTIKIYTCDSQTQAERSVLTYVDEIFVLKNIFSYLQQIKSSIDLWNTRYEEQQQAQKDPSLFDIRVDDMPPKCKTDHFPKTCTEATACTHRSGIYKIVVEKFSNEPFLVECDVKTEGGGWTLIQRRQDGSVNFYRDWLEYQQGFGRIDGEFFIGLDKLYALTNSNGPQELFVVLEDNGEIKQAKYNNFVIGNENQSYALQHLGAYSGNAGDSLTSQLGMKFTTRDRDNDIHDTLNCAQEFLGAWWYQKCHSSNLNGKYGDTRYAKGVSWHSFRPMNISIKHVIMMIRRRRF